MRDIIWKEWISRVQFVSDPFLSPPPDADWDCIRIPRRHPRICAANAHTHGRICPRTVLAPGHVMRILSATLIAARWGEDPQVGVVLHVVSLRVHALGKLLQSLNSLMGALQILAIDRF